MCIRDSPSVVTVFIFPMTGEFANSLATHTILHERRVDCMEKAKATQNCYSSQKNHLQCKLQPHNTISCMVPNTRIT